MIRLKVKEVAEAKGFSMYRLSKETGINEATLRRMYRFPAEIVVNTDTLDRIAEALGVDVRDLLESVPKDRAH